MLPPRKLTATPLPFRTFSLVAGPGDGRSAHPDFSATVRNASLTRLLFFRLARRNCTGSLRNSAAISSMKDSVAKSRGGSPGDRKEAVLRGMGSANIHGIVLDSIFKFSKS